MMQRKEIKSLLLSFNSFNDYADLIIKYAEDYLKPERINYDINLLKKYLKEGFPKGFIIDIKVRCNERISFNDEIRNNDLLVIPEFLSENNYNVWTFNCTLDPKTKKYGIAHLSAQIYRGNTGKHRGIFSRDCIRSDFSKGTWINRTDTNGDILITELGHFGINQHDTGGFFNSSLGCPILESDFEYRNIFKPLLARASNKNNIPCAVFNEDYWGGED